MEEQVFINVPLERLKPVFKNWVKEVLQEHQSLQTPTQPQEKLLTIEQAAEFLNLSVPTIYGKVHRREIPFMKRTKRLYFLHKDLLMYIKAGRKLTIDEISDSADRHLIIRKKRKS